MSLDNGTTRDRKHCESVNISLPSGIKKIVVVDVNTPNDTTMVHEVGHAVGNDHFSARKDKENIMYTVKKGPAPGRKYLWHNQLRKFCNAKS